jgi:hypothetical protein
MTYLAENEKTPDHLAWGFGSSGGKTRTYDLWVMSPTSYQLLHPAILRHKSRTNRVKNQINCKPYGNTGVNPYFSKPDFVHGSRRRIITGREGI